MAPARHGGAREANRRPAGAPGAFDVVDAEQRRIGVLVGMYTDGGGVSGARLEDVNQVVLTPSGALLVYDLDPTHPYPAATASQGYGELAYAAANCQGQPYGDATLPGQFAFLPEGWGPGAPAYMLDWSAQPRPLDFQSRRREGRCWNESGTIDWALPARQAGVVPATRKPLRIVPRG